MESRAELTDVVPGPEMFEGLGDEGAGGQQITLELEVTDPEVLGELAKHRAGPERERFAHAALRLGVLSLRMASGQLDTGAIRQAGDKILGDVRELLSTRAAQLTEKLAGNLEKYFDPQSGALPQRLTALVARDGDLERVLRAHVGGDESMMARTLAMHVGEGSALFKMLSPTEADGLRAQIARTLEVALKEQSARVLEQFSLDHKGSALSRLVAEIVAKQGVLSADLKGQVDAVVQEFSLDKPDSALNRLSRLMVSASEQIDKNLTLDDEQSPLSRIRRELAGALQDIAKKNLDFQSEVKVTLAALSAQRKEAERSTRHGETFEAQLGAAVTELAQRVGDVPEPTGSTTGAIKNCKVGDFVITLGPESAAPGVRIVLEAKEDRSYDLRRALDELEQARKNRQAQVGVFVFSRRTAPEGLEAFSRRGDGIVIVWDADDPATDVNLKAALSLARALVIRERTVDDGRAEALGKIEVAARTVEKQLNWLDDVKRMAETVQANGAKISDRAAKMRADLKNEIDTLDAQLAALRSAESGE